MMKIISRRALSVDPVIRGSGCNHAKFDEGENSKETPAWMHHRRAGVSGEGIRGKPWLLN
ncbi:hypothetical protein WDD9_003779 [Paenibacillus melissococcoides]|uniref:hypothetical protein n=1 Tax=Paenibacillus TaxID=44249 RepID=UPI001BCD36F2|nr:MULTISPECIES: hypothetical protein [Paenibacillus]MEB9894397.1 hypothetical protein [Bacillus cereus]CAH8714139.1 hypothetical protein WDD9_003779 [Paenibacillus melissococcoides]CAH8720093.1 hypothetical protein HTL2_005828 [Paenibacillus melissococcoides]